MVRAVWNLETKTLGSGFSSQPHFKRTFGRMRRSKGCFAPKPIGALVPFLSLTCTRRKQEMKGEMLLQGRSGQSLRDSDPDGPWSEGKM